MKSGKWSESEDDALRSMWRTHSHTEIAKELGRPRSGVRNRCHRLGLVDTSSEWSEEEISKLRSIYEAAVAGCQIGLDRLAA